MALTADAITQGPGHQPLLRPQRGTFKEQDSLLFLMVCETASKTILRDSVLGKATNMIKRSRKRTGRRVLLSCCMLPSCQRADLANEKLSLQEDPN
ncbi:unnamed protein product [Sphagnum tenellum]